MKKLLVLLLFGALAAAYYVNEANRARARHELDEQARIARLEKDLEQEKNRNQSGVEALRQRIGQLKDQYLAEKAALDAIQQRFETLRNRGLPDGSAAVDYDNRLREAKDALSELDAQIRSIKAREADVDKGGRLAKEQQRLGTQMQQADLDAQIHQQQILVDSTQAQIQQLRGQRLIDFDGKTQLRQLQGQLKDQKQQLQALKDARGQVSLQNSSAVTGIDGQVQDNRAQLRQSREQLEARYRQQKIVIAQAQKDLDDSKKDQSGEKQQLARIQADYQAQREKVQAIKAQLDQEQRELDELTHP